MTKKLHLDYIAAPLRPLAVPLSALKPDPGNARTHDDRNIDAVAASLQRFGQQKPVVCDRKGRLIAGHATVLAAKRLGWTHLAAVRSDLAGPDRTAFALADNRTAELAAWDNDRLAAALQELEAQPDSLAVTGFSIEEIEATLAKAGIGVDEVPAPTLPDGDRAPFQQMTFTLHDAQAETVKRALKAAQDAGSFGETSNENSNGNALARIAEAYLGQG